MKVKNARAFWKMKAAKDRRSPNASGPRARSSRRCKRVSRFGKKLCEQLTVRSRFSEKMLREGESMDKNKSHIMTPESTEEIQNLEQQELNLRRRAASKRRAGWTRDGSTEEIASWSVEAERISRQVEAKKRKLH